MGDNFRSLGIQSEDDDWTTVEFGAWTPDLARLNSPTCFEAKNVLPNPGGYGPFPGPDQTLGIDLPLACLGAIVTVNRLGELKIYSATAARFYVRDSLDFFEVYDISPDITVTAESTYVGFVEFGDLIIGFHPQIPTVFGDKTTTDDFGLLAGGEAQPAPQAMCAAQVGDFVVFGNLSVDHDDGSGEFRSRIRWSGFNNPNASWNTDPSTQADFQDMPPEGGAVMSIVGRDVGYVFQQRLISRMTYVGLPNVFNIETAEPARGAMCPGGVVNAGSGIYFIAEDGFFYWNGVSSQPIGHAQVNDYFFRRLNYAYKNKIIGALDDAHGCVWWAYPATDDSTKADILIYSYREQRWSRAEVYTEFLFKSFIPIAAGEDLTDAAHVIASFDSEHVYNTFKDFPMEAIIETADFDSPKGGRVYINNTRPIVDIASADITVSAFYKDQLMGGESFETAAAAMEVDGTCPVEVEGRYVRLRTTIAQQTEWSHARGIDVSRLSSGKV